MAEQHKKKAIKPDGKQANAAQKPGFKMISTKKGYLRPEHSCRCSNCQERISIPLKASEATCPYCKMPYQISWVTPEQPRIMAPIWSAVPGPGPWPPGTPGYIELDDAGNPVRDW
ncbi:hypothetical protein ACFLXN_01365 [Chloroflexota bacterium]